MRNINRALSQAQARSRWPLVRTLCATLAFVGVTTIAFASNSAQRSPSADTLLRAGTDDADWLLPAKTYSGNRYTGLTQIEKTNVATLRMAWQP